MRKLFSLFILFLNNLYICICAVICIALQKITIMRFEDIINFKSINGYLGLKTVIRQSVPISKKHWPNIDHLINVVIPKLWNDYKIKYLENENEKRNKRRNAV